MLGRAMLVVAVISAMAAAAAVAQTPAVRVSVTGRLQTQFNTTSVDGDDVATTAPAASTFESRRVRLGARIQVGDWIEGMLEPDFALGRLQLKQAWMSLELHPAMTLRAGQFKKPFSAIHMQTSTQYAPIERGVRIRGLSEALVAADADRLSSLRGQLLIGEAYALLEAQGYLGYDLGMEVAGESGGLAWAAGVFNGTGADARDENDGKSVAARATYALSAATPVTLGGGWSRRELNFPMAASVETRAGNAFAADVEVGGFRRGWWLVAEGTTGTNLVTEQRFLGAQAALSHFVRTGGARVEGVEPVARVSWGDPDRTVEGDAGVLLTPGFNLYFLGRNRVMFNWDVFRPEGDTGTQHAGRVQFNLHF
jgi:hypothetical protein